MAVGKKKKGPPRRIKLVIEYKFAHKLPPSTQYDLLSKPSPVFEK
jgi:hypothetical protein